MGEDSSGRGESGGRIGTLGLKDGREGTETEGKTPYYEEGFRDTVFETVDRREEAVLRGRLP